MGTKQIITGVSLLPLHAEGQKTCSTQPSPRHSDDHRVKRHPRCNVGARGLEHATLRHHLPVSPENTEQQNSENRGTNRTTSTTCNATHPEVGSIPRGAVRDFAAQAAPLRQQPAMPPTRRTVAYRTVNSIMCSATRTTSPPWFVTPHKTSNVKYFAKNSSGQRTIYMKNKRTKYTARAT